ncbi:MAG: DUF2190 family protein [Campylobacterota bacterium]|nr:DUF2190 family protein [Campylobacterota bacterium]
MNKLFDGNVLIMIALAVTAVRDVVVFADSVGVAQTAGAIGDNISVDTVGVYEFPAQNADTIAVGTVLYWDVADGKVTTDSDSGTNIRAGVSWGVKAGATDGNVGVKIG